MAITRAGVTIAGVAVGGGASFDAAKTGLFAAIDTMLSGRTIQTWSTGKIARRCARAATVRKTRDRSGRGTAKCRTASETRRRTPGTKTRRRTGEHGRRTGGGPNCASAALGAAMTAPSNKLADRIRRVFADIVCLLQSRTVAERRSDLSDRGDWRGRRRNHGL
jgi:hypothetical protein